MEFQHIISTTQFSNKDLLYQLFSLADEMERNTKDGRVYESLHGKVMVTLFYEPSTRTRFSFESAMHRLGGSVISTENATQFSSVTKGETLEDTIRILSTYADVIVLRHSQQGSAARAAAHSEVPIINAGDGTGEHPTQALLDIYTIFKEKKKIEGLEIAMVGDLLYGRTVHSLLHLLRIFENIKIHLVSPTELQLPTPYKEELQKNGIIFEEHTDLESILGKVDVLYFTRVQKERFESPEKYEEVKSCYVLTPESVALLPKDAIIMHPLPRVDEIDHAVDNDPRAAYFRQATNGLYVRMALLELLFDKKSIYQQTLSST